jgi:predicted nuclease of predicted toxin-antitoxin system
MKFLADIGISPKTVGFLQDAGYQAVHLHQLGLDRLQDSKILEKTGREGFILLTHDLDFADLLAASGSDLPSVVIFRLRNMRPKNVNRYLQTILVEHGVALQNGAIVIVSEGRIRVRELPLR